ncbi:MAG: formate hydrogenlyase [Candidatus Moranbacteria bacterium]|jgi:Ni,Fe-hydrogenase III small subunit|nr:formate hydrogenlyase [Candidatus Moranbacteria bacterium]
MFQMLNKIRRTPHLTLSFEELTDAPLEIVGQKVEASVKKLFGGSFAIRSVAAGSSNAEEQELTALGNAYYDIERFGIRFVASPRHADAIFVSGPVSRNMVQGLRHTYEAMPTPRLVVALGDGAIHGSLFKDSYAVVNRVADIIPVDFDIPGDPPSPRQILLSLLALFHDLDRLESQEDLEKTDDSRH